MKLSGVNTYEGTQIGDAESKFNLNCFSREGMLKYRDHGIKFNIPKLPIYEREYSSMDSYDDTTSDDVRREYVTYNYKGKEFISGLVKPSVALFVDTTKFKSGSATDTYLKTMETLKDDYGTGAGSYGSVNGLVDNEIYNAAKNYGTKCEVYKDVVVAVSYSGAYGESGLTKFRFRNNMLHFFLAVHDVSLYQHNPNYKYLNVYVKYGSYESLVLLHKYEIKDLVDMSGHYGIFNNGPISLGDESSDRKFHCGYYSNQLSTRVDDVVSYVKDTDPKNNLLGATDELTISSLIYSGLFQFADEELANPSWFVANKVSPIAPLVDVETQTFLSSEDYTIEDEINTYLDKSYDLADDQTQKQLEMPSITSDIQMLYKEDYVIDPEPFKWTSKPWTNNSSSVDDTFMMWGRQYGSVSSKVLDTAKASTGRILDEVLYDIPYFLDRTSYVTDRYVAGTNKAKAKTKYTGALIVSYYSKDVNGTGETTLIDTTTISITGARYSILSFRDIISKLSTAVSTSEDYFEWIIDVHFNPSAGEIATDTTYRIFSINVNQAWNHYLSNSAYIDNIPTFGNDEEELANSAFRYTTNNIIIPENDDRGWDVPSRDYGFATFSNNTTIDEKRGMYITLLPQVIVNKPSLYTTATILQLGNTNPATAPNLEDPLNFTNDIADVEFDPSSRYDTSYNTFKDGILKRPPVNTPSLRVRTSHIENYDGRMFQVNKETSYGDVGKYDWAVEDIVTQTPNAYDVEAGVMYGLHYEADTDDVIMVNEYYSPKIDHNVHDSKNTLPDTVANLGDKYIINDLVNDATLWQASGITSNPTWTEIPLTINDWLFVIDADSYYRYVDSELGYFTVVPVTPQTWTHIQLNITDKGAYNKAEMSIYDVNEVDGKLSLVIAEDFDAEYKDLYWSQQAYPEMVMETNYKGYDQPITGLKAFIEQLYVFQDTQVDIVKKSLTREVNGIVEPTYQFHKSYDKGAIEWTIKEYEKKVFFTNNEGIFYIDAGGNYNKVSDLIHRLFIEGYITADTVDFAEIKDDFYTIKLSAPIQMGAFTPLASEMNNPLPNTKYLEQTCPTCGGDGLMYNNPFTVHAATLDLPNPAPKMLSARVEYIVENGMRMYTFDINGKRIPYEYILEGQTHEQIRATIASKYEDLLTAEGYTVTAAYTTVGCNTCMGTGFVETNYAIPYKESRKLDVEYISLHIPSKTYWLGNDYYTDDTDDKKRRWFYLSKDFTQRNQYENAFKKKQLKRLSVAFGGDKLAITQVSNAHRILGNFIYPKNRQGRPIRHTLKGNRNFTYGFMLGGTYKTEVLDFALIQNGK